MALITLISTSELTLVFLMTRALDLNFVDIVGIRVKPLVHVPNIKKMTIHKINRGNTIKINRVFLTLRKMTKKYRHYVMIL